GRFLFMVFLLFFSKDFVPDLGKNLEKDMAHDKGEYSEEEQDKSFLEVVRYGVVFTACYSPVLPRHGRGRVIPFLYGMRFMAADTGRDSRMTERVFLAVKALIISFDYRGAKVIFFREVFVFMAIPASFDNVLPVDHRG